MVVNLDIKFVDSALAPRMLGPWLIQVVPRQRCLLIYLERKSLHRDRVCLPNTI